MQQTFRDYSVKGPLARNSGATRSEYINAFALMPAVGLGFLAAEIVVNSGSTAVDFAVGCAAGAVTDLLYLYVAYKVVQRSKS